ncbi:hypothetical protein [Candidatus Sororendozoicomonas aggregata]|uniref:hypothetical protein n=1 Tax=Candidatus Sororendozoicomonas aggregata TaxID=3073239 RepID=UPI002ED3A0A6
MFYNQHSISHTKETAASAIGELILSAHLTKSGQFLAPVLSGLANTPEERWLTLILSKKDTAQTLQWIRTSGIKQENVQVLNPSTPNESISLTRQALAAGTSHTVISWVNTLKKSDLENLELAAQYGKCQGLTIRNRI